jgi:hypothetical protein
VDGTGAAGATITGLVGVYDADHTLRGELAYVVGKRLGRAHCALCDITHGTFRERPEWRRCRDELPVRFDTFHRDDQPAAVRRVIDGRLPAVVATTRSGPVLLLGPEDLEACHSSPERLAEALSGAAVRAGLAWA